jgi:hypothetical protein
MPSLPSIEMPRPKGLSVSSRPAKPEAEGHLADERGAADADEEGLRRAS